MADLASLLWYLKWESNRCLFSGRAILWYFLWGFFSLSLHLSLLFHSIAFFIWRQLCVFVWTFQYYTCSDIEIYSVINRDFIDRSQYYANFVGCDRRNWCTPYRLLYEWCLKIIWIKLTDWLSSKIKIERKKLNSEQNLWKSGNWHRHSRAYTTYIEFSGWKFEIAIRNKINKRIDTFQWLQIRRYGLVFGANGVERWLVEWK